MYELIGETYSCINKAFGFHVFMTIVIYFSKMVIYYMDLPVLLQEILLSNNRSYRIDYNMGGHNYVWNTFSVFYM